MREEHLMAARLIERYLARRSDLTPVQRAPADSKGVPEDWNELVTANRAFIPGERATLLACKQRVDAMRSPAFRDTFALLLEYLGQPWGAWDDQPKN